MVRGDGVAMVVLVLLSYFVLVICMYNCHNVLVMKSWVRMKA
jgi:hypothetical protein